MKLQDKSAVIKVMDHGWDEALGHCWITLELCEFGDMMDVLVNYRRFAVKVAAAIFKQMARAVSQVHQSGFAHLDISLENFLLSKDRTIKLCDFGLALPLTEVKDSRIWPRGKAAYMAPEVASGTCQSMVKADVFSLGVVLYALIGGCFPFKRPASDDINFSQLQQHGVEKLLQGQEIYALFSPSAINLLSKMLALEPDRCSMEEVLSHQFIMEAKSI